MLARKHRHYVDMEDLILAKFHMLDLQVQKGLHIRKNVHEETHKIDLFDYIHIVLPST
jgi:hypothetical protein